jgi:hypothetical protein
MESQLTILLPVAAVWLAAGVLADRLPRLRDARALRRRTGWLLALALAGVALIAAVAIGGLSSAGDAPIDRAAAGITLAAGPALVVAVCSVRRIRRLWAGAGAFDTDLGAEPGIAGPAITVGALVVATIGVRHALRHNRLIERAQPTAASRSTRAAGPLHV